MAGIDKDKKLGLALGGGAVLGAAHIGVLKAFDEFEIRIDYLAGTSIGSFIAALYAFGKTADEIENIALKLDWFAVSRISISQYGLLSNKKMGELIKDNIDEPQFDKANIPLAVITTDIASGEKVVLRSGDVAEAVMASACPPGVFMPVEMDGRLLVDGGLVENVPVSTVREMGAERIAAVDVTSRFEHEKPDNIIELLLNAFVITLGTATKLQTRDAELLLQLDLSAFNMVDPRQAPDLVQKGYEDTKAVLASL